MVIPLLINTAVLITVAVFLHYLIPLAERLLPLRITIMTCVVIALFSVVSKADLWSIMMIIGLILVLSTSLLYTNATWHNRNGRVQFVLNMSVLAITGLLLAQKLMIIALVFVTLIISSVYFEHKFILAYHRKQSYRFLCHIRSISTLTHIEKQLAKCLCQNVTTQLIKKDKLYIDIYYELSPLTQPILMRRLLQLKGVNTLVQY